MLLFWESPGLLTRLPTCFAALRKSPAVHLFREDCREDIDVADATRVHEHRGDFRTAHRIRGLLDQVLVDGVPLGLLHLLERTPPNKSTRGELASWDTGPKPP